MAERIAAGLALNGRFSAGVPDDRVTVEDAIGILSVMPNDYPPGHPLRLSRDQWRNLSYACHAILNDEAKIAGADPEKEQRLFEAFEMFSNSFCEEAGKPAQSAWTLWDSTRDPQEITAGTLIHAAQERIENFVPPGQE